MSILLSSNPREKQSDPRPLYIRLEELLKAEIARDFAPNQRFHSVRQLTGRHDVSTITVTRALRDLVEGGYLYSQRGKGMFVAQRQDNAPYSAMEHSSTKRQKTTGELTISIPLMRTFNEILKEPEGLSKDYLGGIADAAREHGAVVEFQLVPLERTTEYIGNLIENGGPDHGVILYGSTESFYSKFLDKAIYRGIPYVALQPERGLNWQQIEQRNIHYVTTNQQGGLRQATEHLLELGHRRIAYWQHNRTAFTRLAGFRQALCHAGATVDEALIECDFNFDISCVPALRQLISAGATALVTASDYIAIKVLREAKQAGIDIPGQLSVTGFDDNPVAQDLAPALTTVFVDRYETGRQVTLALLKQVNHPEKTSERYQVMTPAKLVVRESTRKCRVDKPSASRCIHLKPKVDAFEDSLIHPT